MAAVSLSLLAIAGPARADISQTFNVKVLSANYALACEKQAEVRKAHMPPPYFPGRPAAFKNESNELVIFSPQLTHAQRHTAERLMQSVPEHVLPVAYLGGAVYVFARRSIVEAVPDLAVEDSWFGDFGLYMAVERRLYFPFEKGEGVMLQRDGKYKARRYVPSQREPFRIINHETGHLVDSVLGDYSLKSTGDDGDSRLSNRQDFLKALNSDLKRLASGKSGLSGEQIKRLGYYMPREFEGKALGGMHPTEQRARREIFAELWAEVQGYDSNKISRAYPETFKVIKSIDQFLKAQYLAIPAHCDWHLPKEQSAR
jgi:hypothetical protein